MSTRTLKHVVEIIESAREEALRALLESKDAKHLHIFDMDGTLALTPGPSRENSDLYRYSTRSRTNPRGDTMHDWWSNPKTLQHPFKIHPIENTLKGYHAARKSPHSRVVVMTGRIDKPDMREAVSQTLNKIGVKGHTHGHDLFLKPPKKGKKGETTAEWKGRMLKRFHQELPHLQHVHMWDDRPEHLDHFHEVLKDLNVKHTLHHVNHPDWNWGSKMPKHS